MMKWILYNLKKLRIYLSLAILLSIGSTFLLIESSDALGDFTAAAGSVSDLHVLGRIFLSALLVYSIYICFDRFVYHPLLTRIQTYTYSALEKKVYEKILSLPLMHEKMQKSADIYTLIQSDIPQTVEYISSTLTSILYQGILIIFTVIHICLVSPVIALVYIGVMILSILFERAVSKSIEKAAGVSKQAETEMNLALDDVLNNRSILRTYQKEDFANACWLPAEKLYTRQTLRIDKIAMPVQAIGNICGMLPIFAIFLAGFYMIPSEIISLSSFLSVYYICQTLVISQMHYIDLIAASRQNSVSVKRIADFCSTKVPKKQTVYNADEIVLENVSYHYDKENTNALSDISLRILKGEKTALVGKSGCGKSTLLILMGDMDRPSDGKIQLMHAALVQQFPFFFHDTIRNNLTLGENISDQKIKEALALTCMQDFDNHLDELLSGNAGNLSGGQKQRLAISRAFLHEQDVLLFDESLSASDNLTADKVMKNILAEGKNKTMVFVLHQKQLLKYMDRVIYMDKGRIVFDGTYGEYEKWAKENESSI
ncbi:MAG: ABC transporter ATP-binding protein [Erysipelotrichaceae bacterium]|nr:ABC transporter ATP-binding protein [Erysipelotrichaceae bacterium]